MEDDGSGSVQERCRPDRARLADSVEENALHMVTSDPKRTPSFTMFGDPDIFFTEQASAFPASCGDCDRLRQPGLRLEPRRRAGRDRQHLVRHGRAGDRAKRRRHEDVDGSRRPAGDDEHAARPSRQLRRRRSGRDADRRQQGAAERASRRATSRSSSATSTSRSTRRSVSSQPTRSSRPLRRWRRPIRSSTTRSKRRSPT